jgi:hypothetical protein
MEEKNLATVGILTLPIQTYADYAVSNPDVFTLHFTIVLLKDTP